MAFGGGEEELWSWTCCCYFAALVSFEVVKSIPCPMVRTRYPPCSHYYTNHRKLSRGGDGRDDNLCVTAPAAGLSSKGEATPAYSRKDELNSEILYICLNSSHGNAHAHFRRIKNVHTRGAISKAHLLEAHPHLPHLFATPFSSAASAKSSTSQRSTLTKHTSRPSGRNTDPQVGTAPAGLGGSLTKVRLG